ncbi:MAG: hypothetical protein WBC05_25790, partial [Sedimentisphaerales bacterium]
MLEYANGAKYRTLRDGNQHTECLSRHDTQSNFFALPPVTLTPFLLDKLIVLLISQKDYELCGNRKGWGMVFSRFWNHGPLRVEKPLRQEVPRSRVILNSELLGFILFP